MLRLREGVQQYRPALKKHLFSMILVLLVVAKVQVFSYHLVS